MHYKGKGFYSTDYGRGGKAANGDRADSGSSSDSGSKESSVLGLRFEELGFRLQVGVEELRFEELGLQELGRRELVVQEARQLQARGLTRSCRP